MKSYLPFSTLVEIGKSLKKLPRKVNIFEVSPRDGLQDQRIITTPEFKINLINLLSQTGLRNIEVGAFVSPKKVPAMANSEQVFSQINKYKGINYSSLIPNMKGFQKAIDLQAQEVAIFISSSEYFSQKNIDCTIKESIQRVKPVVQSALQHNMKVRAYLSCVTGCPFYRQDISPTLVATLVRILLDMGCYMVSLGDTTGRGEPEQISNLLDTIIQNDPSIIPQLAVHFHDTNQRALENILVALEKGIINIDSSVFGLGGCPFAGPDARGNVATEDVVQLMNALGIDTQIDLEKLKEVIQFVEKELNISSRAFYKIKHRSRL